MLVKIMDLLHKLINLTRTFFKAIADSLLFKSIIEVTCLTIIALLPLFTSVIIQAVRVNDFSKAAKEFVVPAEMIAFSLSFIAPPLFFIVKTHGGGHRLPWLKFIWIVSIAIYVISGMFYILAKNALAPEINMQPHDHDLYFYLSISFFCATFLVCIYSTYYAERTSDFGGALRKGQRSFNSTFRDSINQVEGATP